MATPLTLSTDELKNTGGTVSGAPAVKNENVALLSILLPSTSVISGVRYALYQLANANWPELIIICAVFGSKPCDVTPLTLVVWTAPDKAYHKRRCVNRCRAQRLMEISP